VMCMLYDIVCILTSFHCVVAWGTSVYYVTNTGICCIVVILTLHIAHFTTDEPLTKPTFPDQLDFAPLSMFIPVPVAFKHLTCVYSYKTIPNDMPKHYNDSNAVYSTYESARATLQLSNNDVKYQSMVHRLKNKPRVTFAAATFSLLEHNKRSSSKYVSSDVSSDYDEYSDNGRERSGSTNTTYTTNTTNTINTTSTFRTSKSNTTSTTNATPYTTIPKVNKSVTVIGKPAFVIKTHRTDNTKIFINVLHHVCFDTLIINDVIQVAPHEEPLTGIGNSYTSDDKHNNSVVVYNVLIASSYIKKAFRRFEKRVTDPGFIKTVSVDIIVYH